MYQGKFNAQNKPASTDVYTLLEQRKQQQLAKTARQPGRAMPQQARPQANPAPAAPRQPKAQMPQPPAAPSKPRVRKGTLVFYACCLAFVFVFYLATFLGMRFLKDWLVRYEAAQPTVKCEEVFQDLFGQPDWENLYSVAGLDNSAYEGPEAFAAYMTQRVGEGTLSYLETSAGLSGDKKYIVRAGDDRIAVFTLEDLNNAEAVTDVPDWQLKSLEFYLAKSESVRIIVEEGSQVSVNGVLLDESAIIAIRNPKANDYLPTFAPAPKVQVLEVNGLMTQPVVEVHDPNGQLVEPSYDEASATYTALGAASPIPQEREELALKTLETYAMYMSGKAGAGELAKYFDKNSEAYQTIRDADLTWVQKGSNYTFTDESVTDYRVYNEEIFSVRVSVNLNITRSEDGSVRENIITQSLFFTKNSAGSWVCFQMTAVDVNQYTEQVKLTFLDGEMVLSSEFVDSAATVVMCPEVVVPEGKTLAGWTVEDTDENGRSVLRLVFTPDENGMAAVLGDGLTSMTLKPLFE